MGTLGDDAEAWAAVLRRRADLAVLEGRLQTQAGMALRQVLAFVPNGEEARAALEAAFADLGR